MRLPKFRGRVNKAVKKKYDINKKIADTFVTESDGTTKSVGGGPSFQTLQKANTDIKNAMAKRRKGIFGLVRKMFSPRATRRLENKKEKIIKEKEKRPFILRITKSPAEKAKMLLGIKLFDEVEFKSKNNSYKGIYMGLTVDNPRQMTPLIKIKITGNPEEYQYLNLNKIVDGKKLE